MPNNHRHPGGKLRLHNLALAVASLDIMIDWYENVLGFTVAERGRFDVVGADYALIEAMVCDWNWFRRPRRNIGKSIEPCRPII